jgi:hypothetical protein
VPELVIWERPPSTLRNINDDPPRGARAKDPELKVGERPPSTLRNVDGRPPRGAGGRFDSSHHRS